MDKQINHGKHHDESKTMTHRLSKLPDDGDPWAPNNLLTSEQKKKKQLNPGGPSNRQEIPVSLLLLFVKQKDPAYSHCYSASR